MRIPPWKQLLIALIGMLLLGTGYIVFAPVSFKTSIKDKIITARNLQFEVVSSSADQERGLGGRSYIPDDYAMLFVFNADDRYGFWMKDMLVPIDIIWLSDNGEVLLVDSSVQPSTYPHVFYPPQPVRYVLETKSGYAHEKNIDVGSVIPLPAPYGTGS